MIIEPVAELKKSAKAVPRSGFGASFDRRGAATDGGNGAVRARAGALLCRTTKNVDIVVCKITPNVEIEMLKYKCLRMSCCRRLVVQSLYQNNMGFKDWEKDLIIHSAYISQSYDPYYLAWLRAVQGRGDDLCGARPLSDMPLTLQTRARRQAHHSCTRTLLGTSGHFRALSRIPTRPNTRLD